MPQRSREARVGTDLGLFLVRLGLAAVFVVSGYQKLTGFSATVGFFGSLGIPAPTVTTALVAVAEFFGGLGLLVGVLPRFSSSVFVLVMAVSTLTFAWPQGGWQRARLDVVLGLASLAIALAGPGRWTIPEALDRPDLDLETPILERLRA